MWGRDRNSELVLFLILILLPLLFNFAEPASPLVVDGLERIHEWLVELEG